jgi:SAM-dependent methyltransferase
MAEKIQCVVCRSDKIVVRQVGDLKRCYCHMCHHCQRLDIPFFDYRSFAIGDARDQSMLDSQADFLSALLSDDMAAIEIGCAFGDLAATLKSRHRFRRFDGIELSPAGDKAQKILDRVFDASLSELLEKREIEEGSYDLVLISHCLEHVCDPHQIMADLKNLLAPGGLLFIEVPNRSGNKGLPFDDNYSHIHFFSIASLSCLLACHGLEIKQMQTGAWHCVRVPDSIRVVAAPFELPPDKCAFVLSDCQLLGDENELIVWPAGKMVQELLLHFFDPARIAFFVDSDSSKDGTLCMGKPVRSPAAISQTKDCVIFINSLDYEESIRSQIAEQFSDRVRKIISMRELLSAISPDRLPSG